MIGWATLIGATVGLVVLMVWNFHEQDAHERRRRLPKHTALPETRAVTRIEPRPYDWKKEAA